MTAQNTNQTTGAENTTAAQEDEGVKRRIAKERADKRKARQARRNK